MYILYIISREIIRENQRRNREAMERLDKLEREESVKKVIYE